jgi:acetolactate synthase small subunit
MRPFEIVELVRTGRIAMVRGQRRSAETPAVESNL